MYHKSELYYWIKNKTKKKKNTIEGLFDERPKHFHLENQPPFTAQLFGVLCCLPGGASLRTRLLHSSNWHTYCEKATY